MNEIFYKQLDTFNLTVYGTPSDPLFKAKEIGDILGINNIRERLRRIPSEWKVLISTKTNGGNQDMTFINKNALIKILKTTRKDIPKRFLEHLNNFFNI